MKDTIKVCCTDCGEIFEIDNDTEEEVGYPIEEERSACCGAEIEILEDSDEE